MIPTYSQAPRTRKRILALSSRFPYPMIGGDRLRVYHFLRLLSRTYDVDLLSLNHQVPRSGDLAHMRSFLRDVKCFPVSALRSVFAAATGVMIRGLPLQVGYYFLPEPQRWVADKIRSYDLIFCFHVRMAEYVLAAECPKIVDLVDAISMNYSLALDRTPSLAWRLIYRFELPRLLSYEKKVITAFDRSLLISQIDKNFLVTRGAARDRISVVPNGTELFSAATKRERGQDIDIVFQGNMKTQPNQGAAIFLVEKILPLLRLQGRRPNVYIVGTSPPRRVTRLSKNDGVVVTGEVEDVAPYILRAKVVAAPMMFGAGVQNKILEAMALGKPVVTTGLGAEGIEGVHGVHYLVADGAPAFADKLALLLDEETLRNTIGTAAQRLIQERYTWSHVEKALRGEVDLLL